MQKSTAVIIPVCNRPAELNRAINSVLLQTYRVSEIIVVENNSDDVELLATVVQSFNDSRIFFKTLNSCTNANIARNFGASLATSDLLLFLDSDDEWKPEHVENCLNSLNNEKADFVYGGAEVYNGESYYELRSRKIKQDEKPIDFILGLNRGHAQTSSFCITKKGWSQIKWDEKLNRHQDYDFFIRSASCLNTAYNPNLDYIIHWKKGDKRTFHFSSFKIFYLTYSSEMKKITKLYYLIDILKVSLKNKHIEAVRFYTKEILKLIF